MAEEVTKKTKSWVKWVVIGVVALAGIGAISGGKDSDSDGSARIASGVEKISDGGTKSESVQISNAPSIPRPGDEEKFIKANVDARAAYRAASNDMAKGGTRAGRKSDICSALSGFSIQNWVGTISTLDSNSDGKGVLSIEVADDVRLKTWNNSLSDIGDNTLIDPSSPLFAEVSSLKKGDLVEFSGAFIQNDTDCVKETSMGLRGSMTDPEWLFRFSAVRKL